MWLVKRPHLVYFKLSDSWGLPRVRSGLHEVFGWGTTSLPKLLGLYVIFGPGVLPAVLRAIQLLVLMRPSRRPVAETQSSRGDFAWNPGG